MIVHPIPPVFNKESEILILGSFPSVRSRETGFFYGHPRNRFWEVLAYVRNAEEPLTVEEKKAFLLRERIALWDVVGSCEITGSSDSSIRSVVPNDLSVILDAADIRAVYCNGKTAFNYYRQFAQTRTQRPAVCLPSTSPANAAWSLERLKAEWKTQMG